MFDASKRARNRHLREALMAEGVALMKRSFRSAGEPPKAGEKAPADDGDASAGAVMRARAVGSGWRAGVGELC